MEEKTMPRGYRNNNPCNLRKGQPWQGLDTPPDDGAFCRFTSMTYGFRAALKLLHTYYYKHRLRNTRAIIERWAPESDGNNVYHYASYVAGCLNKRPKSFLPYPEEFRWEWVHFVVAMAEVENGINVKDRAELEFYAGKAWDMLYKKEWK